ASVPVTGVGVEPPTAELTVGETVELTAEVEPANADEPGVTWASSDTSVATVSNTGVVSGESPGTATITATTVEGGFMGTSEITVNDENLAPTAVPKANVSIGSAPLEVNFDGSLSTDSDGTIVSYFWDFDDMGNSNTSISPSYTFNEVGTYEVELKVTDNDGEVDSETIIIEVVSPSYVINITSPDPGPSGYNYGDPVPFAITITPNQSAVDLGISFSMRFTMNGVNNYFRVEGSVNFSEGSSFSIPSGNLNGFLDYGWSECDDVDITFYVDNNLGLTEQEQTLTISFNDSECP
ncbi:PKD domain-containing protein, partial [Zobellia galactanivorans]|uniref:PKD domain-containing protein n=1 Tax=Zobellia galactanivorans (strain DSM 12802 / CCUG 47099 / CIP 106680 / NCIMB 13871 / Dsij) TaxID=63186 RepID=UPI0026E3AD18